MDYHIHTNHSIDGEMTIDEVCRKAISLGIKEIAFTDHIDLDWPDPEFDFASIDIEQYILEIDQSKAKYKGQLRIKTGIEIGMQPHVLDETAKIIEDYPFDFVIGSVHIIQRMDPYQGKYYIGKTKEEFYRLYYEETLRLIKEFSYFDVLGHIGYIKRYSPLPYEKEDDLLHLDLVDEILRVLIKEDKGIEVNTSGFRHISNSSMPSIEIVRRYKELGGTVITLGSDSHKLSDFGFGLKDGLETIIQAGFNKITTYTKRKPYFHSISKKE
ncbi:MAG: histidinol-phosphatase HisJ family protein [Caldicoprobacterales bacterium]